MASQEPLTRDQVNKIAEVQGVDPFEFAYRLYELTRQALTIEKQRNADAKQS